MRRRSFILGASQALVFALTARQTHAAASEQQPSQVSPTALEQRVANVLQTYDGQGNHRTGTEVDNASAEWLANQTRKLGVEPSLEPFALSRVDLRLAYARIADRRIDGVPMFDGTFTAPDGVSGRLGPLGSDADIGLAETLPAKVAQTGEADILSAARRTRHTAVILVTGGSRAGLFLNLSLIHI